MPIFSIPPDIQVPAAIAFSAGYAGLEAIALENYLRVLGTTKPKVGTLYSYHLFGMLPAFIGTSFLIGYDDRIFAAGYNPITDPEPALRSLANMIETFVPLVIMEDIFYFVIRGFDRRHPDTFKTYRIKKDDWTCFPPEELILTESGYKPIAEIQEGERVMTHRGRFRRVTSTMSRWYDGPLINIKSRGTLTSHSTPEHPYLTFNRKYVTSGGSRQYVDSMTWVDADKLESRDGHVTMTVYPALKEIVDKETIELEIPVKLRGKPQPVMVQVDERLMRIIGYYLAEGFASRMNAHKTDYDTVVWTFGKSTEEFIFASQVAKDLNDIGFRCNITLREFGYRVRCHSKSLARFMVENFGTGATRKTLPMWAILLPPSKLNHLFNAYIDGDGYRKHNALFVATSVSKELMVYMRLVGMKLGYASSILGPIPQLRDNIQGRKVSTNPIWMTTFSDGNGTNVKLDGEMQYSSIQKKSMEYYRGLVYNIEVEDDQSYCTVSHAVHNCKKFGCFDAGFTAVPKWYVAGAGLATLVWLLNNVVFPRPAP